MSNHHIDLLNRRLADRLGGSPARPRFQWKFAPDEPMLVYDINNVNIVRKSWADMAGPDGNMLGPVWLLAALTPAVPESWNGNVRVPAKTAGYSPYFETALPYGRMPTEAQNQHLISDIDRQLSASVEHDPHSFENYMSDEKSTSDANKAREKAMWREVTAGQYDDNVGAFGNCEPGARGGYMSFGGI